MKILLVEDSATLRFAMESYISEVGHETIIAENGETAVQIVDQMPIDMVIMDVEMPGLDGFDTTRLIRESLHDLSENHSENTGSLLFLLRVKMTTRAFTRVFPLAEMTT